MNMNALIKFNQSLLIAGFLTLSSAPILAAPLTAVPNTFAAGDTIIADEMNANFTDVITAVDDNNSNIDALSLRVDSGTAGAGSNLGDMQYWNGTDWALVPAPAANAKTLSFCGGVPTWTYDGCYNIGDRGPAGGIVFYITDGGAHGLEAALVDQSAGVVWGCHGVTLSGADGTAVGTGAQNTLDIVAGCTTEVTAADVADAYTLNGYNDWFLPSADELNLLYQQKAVVGGFVDTYYKSSTGSGSSLSWHHSFIDGSASWGQKSTPHRVRAVRAF